MSLRPPRRLPHHEDEEPRRLCDLAPLDWETAASASLPEGQVSDADGGPGRYTAWLTTINADGSPHVSGVGKRWDDGAYWIVSGRAAARAETSSVTRGVRSPFRPKNTTSSWRAWRSWSPTRTSFPQPSGTQPGAGRARSTNPARPSRPVRAPSAGASRRGTSTVTPTKATALLVQDPGGATSWSFDG